MADFDVSRLPVTEFAFPGSLRDALVSAVLSGSKTSTTGVLAEYELDGAQLPTVGQHSVVVDSDSEPVAIIEVTGVRTCRLDEVDLAHAVDEGEGFTSVAQWRADHEQFWHSDSVLQAMGDPQFTVDDSTMLVLERFRLVSDLR